MSQYQRYFPNFGLSCKPQMVLILILNYLNIYLRSWNCYAHLHNCTSLDKNSMTMNCVGTFPSSDCTKFYIENEDNLIHISNSICRICVSNWIWSLLWCVSSPLLTVSTSFTCTFPPGNSPSSFLFWLVCFFYPSWQSSSVLSFYVRGSQSQNQDKPAITEVLQTLQAFHGEGLIFLLRVTYRPLLWEMNSIMQNVGTCWHHNM